MKKSFLVIFLVSVLFLAGCAEISYSGVKDNQEYVVDEHTIALWHFNEGNGTVLYDETNNSNDGTINGANWTEGKFGNGLSFDGFDDKVVIPDSSSFLTQYEVTLEAWVKRDSYADGTIFSKNGPFFLGIRDNKIVGSVYAGGTWSGVNGTTDLELGRWYHLASTYDGESIKVYIDGFEEASIPKTGDILMHSHTVYIGWGESGQDQYFDGIIDEVRISNIAREFGGCTGEEYFCDDFNDGNADGWNIYEGNWSVIDNSYQSMELNPVNNYAITQISFNTTQHYSLSSDFKFLESTHGGILGGDHMGLCSYMANSNQHEYGDKICVSIHPLETGQSKAILWIYEGGEYQEIQQIIPSIAYEYGVWHNLKLNVNEEGDITVFWDENLIIEGYQTILQPIGYVSFGSHWFLGEIDNVKVYLNEPEPPLDTDEDGVIDENDNCVNVFNAYQRDFDNDGVGDWCDNCIIEFNPNQVDSNGNEMGDACEKNIYQCSAIGGSLGF